MKLEPAISIFGIIMMILGLILFYSIQRSVGDPTLTALKSIGTFVGLMGIGVIVAGVLLHLINKNQPPIQENFEP